MSPRQELQDRRRMGSSTANPPAPGAKGQGLLETDCSGKTWPEGIKSPQFPHVPPSSVWMSSLTRHPCSHGDKPKAQTAHSAEYRHRLHHPCPSGIPEIGMGKRKWVVLALSLGKIPSKCVCLLISVFSHTLQRIVLGVGGGGCTTSKGGREWEILGYLTPHPLYKQRLRPEVPVRSVSPDLSPRLFCASSELLCHVLPTVTN